MTINALGVGALFLVVAFAGCLGGGSPAADSGHETLDWPRGVHPWPTGDEWPEDLRGPFDLASVVEHRVAMHDGVELEGWVLRPDVPDDVPVPVVLWSAPYFGQCSYLSAPPACAYATGDDPALRDGDLISEAVPIDFLIENGYAVAVFNVRGTGNSGGCFEWFGPNEQRDQAILVDWLAGQEWSNGRVAMQGLSYHGTTPWEAAIQNPEGLKTIVVAGMIGDAYTFSHTPQGATFTTISAFNAHFAWRVSLSPPIQGGPEHATVEHVPVAPERVCPSVIQAMTEDSVGTLAERRDQGYWDDRRLIDHFPEVTAAVFLTHGFQDHHYSGHQQQENAVWDVLTNAPKRQLEGQWGHEFPNHNSFNTDWALDDWYDRLLEWYDFWLKGVGDAPPREGMVDYQDGTGAWHASTAWPPVDAHDEVLYLAEGRLAPAPGGAASSFQSVAEPLGPAAQFCPDEAAVGPAPTGLAFLSEPAKKTSLVAGNPIAYLRLTSDLPGGLVAVHLYDVAPDFECTDGGPDGVRLWAAGVADLRFHEGTFQAEPFPIDTPTHVRVDITNLAEVLEPDHRLAVVLSYGDPIDRVGHPWPATITPLADGDVPSHIVVPFVEGGLGGSAPTHDYPPRPFVPQVD